MGESFVADNKEIIVSDEVLFYIPTGSGNLRFERTAYSFLGVDSEEKKALTEMIESRGGVVIPPCEYTTYLICIPDKAKLLPYWDEAKAREEVKTIYLLTPFLFRLWSDDGIDFDSYPLDQRIAAADHYLKHKNDWKTDRFNVVSVMEKFMSSHAKIFAEVLFKNGSSTDVKRFLNWLLEKEKDWINEGFSDGFFTYEIVKDFQERVTKESLLEKTSFYFEYKNSHFSDEIESDHMMHEMDVEFGLIDRAPIYYSIGSTVQFGRYYINSDELKEPVNWEVLANDGEKILLFAKDIIASRQYNSQFRAVTWERCSLRQWLNEEFIDDLFTQSEKEKILTIVNENPGNSYRNTKGGNPTEDKLFLLSEMEAVKLTAGHEHRSKKVTPYARANGAWCDGNLNGWWWLRTPGFEPERAVSVTNDGSVGGGGNKVNRKEDGVCPAFWIKIEDLSKAD